MRHILLTLLTLAIATYSRAQADIHFSQFYETTILRNPALTGIMEDNYKVTAFGRRQWSTVADPYETALINAEYRLKFNFSENDFLSFGLLGYTDKAGDLSQRITGVYPVVNFNKCINPSNNSYISAGFTCGYVQYDFSLANARVNNQFVGGIFSASNPTLENFPPTSHHQIDLGAGVNYNISPGEEKATTYFFGVSAYHFNNPKFTYYNQGFAENTRWNVNAGFNKRLNETYKLLIPVNYATQGSYNELVFGGLVGWRTFSVNEHPDFELYAGALYRLQDAIIPAIKVMYQHMVLGISYDVNTSTLTPASHLNGGFEISLSVSGNYPRNPDYKVTMCPRF